MKRTIIRKITVRTLIVLLVIALAGGITLRILYNTNKYVKSYFDMPGSVISESIGLSLALARNYVVPYDVDQEKINEVKAEQLENSVLAGGEWLIRMQETQGRFNYWYNAGTDSLSPRYDDNFLRQAGTCYSLCVSAEVTGDTNLLNSAVKSIDYLRQYKRIHNDSMAYFYFNRKAKLGGIALPMLAMLKIRELKTTTRFDEELKQCARMIMYLQDLYGTGQFKSTFVYVGNYEYDWHSQIYPGEAMYALSEMYKQFGDEVYKTRLDSAARFYDSSKYWGKSAFMPWTISALSNMYMITSDSYYLEYAKKITDRMLLTQNMRPKGDAYGSWNPVPMVNSSTCMEALGDLVEALRKEGDPESIQHYANHAILGYRWLMQLQFDEEDSKGLARPELALGGFPSSPVDSNIRIDNTQHSITALAKGVKHVYQQPAKLK